MEEKVPLNRWFSVILETIRSEINREMRLDGVDSAEFSILMYLYMYGDGLNQKQLTDLLVIDRAAVSRSIQRLIAKGYISKQTSPTDKRAYIIYLTEEGHRLDARLSEVYDDLFNQLGKGLHRDDLYRSIEALKTVYNNALRIKAQH